jgi:hypothetical protein
MCGRHRAHIEVAMPNGGFRREEVTEYWLNEEQAQTPTHTAGNGAKALSRAHTGLLSRLLRAAMSNAEYAIGDISDCAIDVEPPH